MQSSILNACEYALQILTLCPPRFKAYYTTKCGRDQTTKCVSDLRLGVNVAMFHTVNLIAPLLTGADISVAPFLGMLGDSPHAILRTECTKYTLEFPTTHSANEVRRLIDY